MDSTTRAKCQYIDYNSIQHSLPYITGKYNIRIVCRI